MGSVLGELLPLAVGVAISPIPIIGAILMLLGRHARTTSIGFMIGWIAGIAVATTVFVLVGGAFGDSTSTAGGWIKVVLGVVLLSVGLRQWRSRTGDHATPKWIAAIDDMKVPAALGLGFVLSAINPKNLMMCIAAGVTIASAGLSASSDTVAVIVFTVLAATTVAVPVIAYQVAAQRLRDPLDRLKVWLEANNSTVMAVLILVIGFVLIGKGISGIS
ncbi:GAP family protein [Gordonia sp. LSe1-13]|uniref:GAP family protein n=1 Tax=Gordonia sesuvii TaxID=3116777 RepID=A0ABU7MEG0_9ACTN|nr:GAP family protein [Gordonia sp. LSe1-13]